MEHTSTAQAKRTTGLLALEDGQCFTGISVGYEGLSTGEVVFTTSITGYQETITDPAFAGQIVVMTAPQIGNVGVNHDDDETIRPPSIRGVLVREYSARFSNWRATESLGDFFQRHKIVALSEIDTRSLTHHLRTKGTLRGVVASGDWDAQELIQKAKESLKIDDMDLIPSLSVIEPVFIDAFRNKVGRPKKIIIFDFGLKQNMIRYLTTLNAEVMIVPYQTTAEYVLDMSPDDVVLSSGAGNPARLDQVVKEIKQLLGKVPIRGIAFGHQILARALGASTFKLPFGHHGNQPVMNLQTGKVEMTAQNHGFCVVPDSLPPEIEITHTNLHDGSIEGFRHKELPIVATQFHPKTMFDHWE